MVHPYFADIRRPRVLAHRGLITQEAGAFGAVDNSLVALAAADAAGVAYIESDCRLTYDGVVVLFHDEDLVRVAGDARKVADIPFDELSRIMDDHGGLVTLEQALETFPRLRFNLDVKADRAARPAGALVGPHSERVLLTSFSDERRIIALDAAARTARHGRPATAPGVKTVALLLAALAGRSSRRAARLLDGLDALQVPERRGPVRVLSPRLLEASHRHGVEVHVWTVNDPLDMHRFAEMGVDGIVTDRADTALKELG